MDQTIADPGWRPPTLTTQRLVLRAFEPADAPSLYRAAGNPNISRFTYWEYHKSIETSQQFISDYVRSKYLQAEPDPFAICIKERPQEVVGAIGAHWANRTSLCMELGYWIAEPHWGQGLIVEAAAIVLRWLFANYTLERVQAHCMAENQASAKVLARIGMQHEGTSRSGLYHRGRFWDLHWFSILRDEAAAQYPGAAQ